MKKWIIIGLVFITIGCEKSTDWELKSADSGMIVVDGMMTDVFKSQTVSVMYPSAELNGIQQPVSGANVSITDGNVTWVLEETDTVKGLYGTHDPVIGMPGRNYTVNIMVNGKHYTASDRMPSNTFFDQLKYEKNKNDDLYHITWVADPYSPQSAAMYKVLLDWSYAPGYENTNPDDCKATLYYYSLTTIDVSNIFSPELEKISFPAGTRITERKYALSPQYENFIRCLLLETEWRGGLFDAVPSNVPTNLSHRGVGFFSACSVQSISLTVNP